MNNIYYLLKGEDFLDFVDTTTRKSIPYKYIEEKGYVIKENYQPTLDYITTINDIYFKGE